MRAAAAMEDGTEKSAVTPGPLAPARELLGEMLLQLKQPADALDGIRSDDEEGAEPVPRRVRRREGGVARAADAPKSSTYCGQLVKICERGGQARTAGAGRGTTMAPGAP